MHPQAPPASLPVVRTRAVARTYEADGWLTAVLRPAGSLDTSRLAMLVQALTALAASSDMLIVDLTATTVPDPQQLALALREPAQRFAAPARCLLLVGGSSDVLRSLARAGVQAAILTADALSAASPHGTAP